MLALLRRLLLATGVALVVWMVIRKLNEPAPQPATGTAAWPPLETTAPAAPAPTGSTWVEPDQGQCPSSHPVKGKLSSGIYHPPDGAAYDRTRADRCYVDPQAAEADGLRASKI